MLPEIVIISFSSLGGFLTKFEKVRCEKKNPKQTKQILKSYRTQAEVLATIIYKLYRTISTVPDMRSQWGFQQFYPERVIQLSRPDGRSYWTLRKRDWNFPDSYLVPYTSLQDGSLACNGTFRSESFPHFAAR